MVSLNVIKCENLRSSQVKLFLFLSPFLLVAEYLKIIKSLLPIVRMSRDDWNDDYRYQL